MACGCSRRAPAAKYVWTSADVNPETGEPETVIYDSLVQARAKVMRAGGTYKPQSG